MGRSKKSVDAVVRAVLAEVPAPSPAAPYAVAFSGGLDSTVLLHALVRCFGPECVRALHVHHGLQALADDWVAHCAAVARGLGVDYQALYAADAPGPGDSVEHWARQTRYGLLIAAAKQAQAQVLLTGHHADDQLETLLWALGRGCGLDGLSGIAPLDWRDGLRVVRPLLELERATLLWEAQRQGLTWVDDPTNVDQRWTRNAVRAQVVPAMRQVFPNVMTHLAETVGALRNARALLDDVAAADLAAVRAPGPWGQRAHGLNRRALAALPPIRQGAVLRHWLKALHPAPPARGQLLELAKQLVTGGNASAQVTYKGWQVLRDRDLIGALRPAALKPVTPFERLWQGEFEWSLPDGGRLVFESVAEGLDPAWLHGRGVRVAQVPASAQLAVAPRRPRRSLKNLRQEAGIPACLRAGFPGVWVAGELVWAAPFGMNYANPWPQSRPGLNLRWHPGSDDDPRAWPALGAAFPA